MPEIYETLVSTQSAAGRVHLAPMGVRYEGQIVVLMPFKPSATLDNILATGRAILNLSDDARVFAGCVTGRREWPTEAVEGGRRLRDCLAHVPLTLAEHDDDRQRPVLRMQAGEKVVHGAFPGFNRARAAIIEAAVLVSRLDMLAAEKVDAEMRYLQIAIDRTAGARELEAWRWLQAAVAEHRTRVAQAGGQ